MKGLRAKKGNTIKEGTLIVAIDIGMASNHGCCVAVRRYCRRDIAQCGVAGQQEGRLVGNRAHGNKDGAVERVLPSAVAGRADQSDSAHDGVVVGVGDRCRRVAIVDERAGQVDRNRRVFVGGSHQGAGATSTGTTLIGTALTVNGC